MSIKFLVLGGGGGYFSDRPKSLLLSLGGAIQTLAWVLSWARPGPIPGPRWSSPDSPCALFYSVSDPSRSRGRGHPRPSLSHPAPERSLQDRAWTGRNRLLGHFRILVLGGGGSADFIFMGAGIFLRQRCPELPQRALSNHVREVQKLCIQTLPASAGSIHHVMRFRPPNVLPPKKKDMPCDFGGHGEESNRPNCPKVVRGEC